MSTAEKGVSNDQGFVNGDNNANVGGSILPELFDLTSALQANVSRFITPGGHPADSSQVRLPSVFLMHAHSHHSLRSQFSTERSLTLLHSGVYFLDNDSVVLGV